MRGAQGLTSPAETPGVAVMQVRVSGKHVDVGQTLRERIQSELAEAVGHFFERGGAADVVVSRDGPAFRVDCEARLASGRVLRSHGLAAEAPAAFAQALANLQTRVRRFKKRQTSHSTAAEAKAAETAAFYVLKAPDKDGEAGGWEEAWEGADSEHPPGAVIVAETEAALKTMTVSMAVLDLDLTDSQTIVFRNAAHGGLSVVYRRPDGNIGWIDPRRTSAQGSTGGR